MDRRRENNAERRVGLRDENINTLSDDELSVDGIFENEELPSWTKPLTIRAFVVSFVLSVKICFIIMKLNFGVSPIPSFTVASSVLGFFYVKILIKTLEKAGMLKQPWTRQEITVIQTCVSASTGISFSGGYGTYLLGMSEHAAKQTAEAKHDMNYKNPTLGWMISFLFVTSFSGLFSVVSLRKVCFTFFLLVNVNLY
ncbi:probable metal-nicotianamine transporter YSL7 [Olea europaea subsp. europaea]|uniref:Probable metal-nicotianamine transporter YSL7 n=1 Tax=Olea europaea subsp. europaea TaxID=158383 RepID=A0A8S0SB88_OLEEU|nr:probable metal-nicotianamine transporter YSL7 [Olea europaea subsp. europaea]